MTRATTPAIPPRLRVLQALDRRLGPALLRLARPKATGDPGPIANPARVLVIRPGGLGDAILLQPMLAALRAAWPAAEIDVLAERRNAAAFSFGAVTTVHTYDTGGLALLRRLRARRYELVIDTEQYHHLSVLAANALRPRWLAGFDGFGRGRFQTHRVAHSEDDYEAISFLRLAEAVTGRAWMLDPEAPFIRPGAAEETRATEFLGEAHGRQIAVLMPVAGGAFRLWPAGRWAEVARRLAGEGARVVVLGGADGAAAAREISSAVPDALDLTGRTTLGETAAILARAAVAVSADTGVLHLAYAVGTPTVALFGPGLHRKWAPPGRRHRLVRKGLACSPCIRLGRLPPCPYGIACMREITAREVGDAAVTLL